MNIGGSTRSRGRLDTGIECGELLKETTDDAIAKHHPRAPNQVKTEEMVTNAAMLQYLMPGKMSQ